MDLKGFRSAREQIPDPNQKKPQSLESQGTKRSALSKFKQADDTQR